MRLNSGDLLDDARAAARAGEWARVAEILEPVPSVDNAEGAVLLAEAFLRLGRPGDARAWLATVVPALERRADRVALRKATNMAGAAAYELGDLNEAERVWSRALVFAEADQDTLLLARATNNLGIVANVRGQREKALGIYRSAVPVYQQLGHAVGLAECYHNMAITHRDLGELGAADGYERRAIEFAAGAGNERLEALARLGLAEITFRGGDVQLAGAAARHVASDFARLSEPNREADARRLSGLARLDAGDAQGAEAEVGTALDLARLHGGALVEAESLRALGEIAASRHDTATARARGAEALEVFERMGARDDASRLRDWLEALG